MRTQRAGVDGGLLCPSAHASTDDAVLIGVVTSRDGKPHVVPTESPLPVTRDLLDLAQPVEPREVFRFASACRAAKCVHFVDDACELAARGVVVLDPVVAELPACSIRSQCRWFRQEGAAICRRCPQIVTDTYRPSAEMLRVVYGEDPPAA